ncbi:MAG: hypothetical protein Kow0099_01840 [Candidatus Abyssubacteria bacterium]
MRKFSISLLLIAVSFHLSSTASAEQTSVRTYKLPRHGSLELPVPVDWKDEIRRPPYDMPPTIILRPATGDEFILAIRPLWDMKGEEDPNSDPKVKQLIEEEIPAVEARADEDHLVVNPIKGPEAYGYYYAATDIAPKPGEWEYLVRAGVATGELLLSAILLTHQKEAQAVNDTLTMLRNTRQIKEDPNADYRYPPKFSHERNYSPPTHEQKMWALATHAIITEANRERHDLPGGCERTPEAKSKQREPRRMLGRPKPGRLAQNPAVARRGRSPQGLR